MNNPFEKSLVSIIVPVYKVERNIKTCVESVLSQTYSSWELILVDDGSPDNCPAICDEYARLDKRIRVIHKENGGQASARNAGLDNHLQGDYITFLDSDDFWHKEYLSTLIGISLENDADIVQCGFVRGCEEIFPSLIGDEKTVLYDNHSVFVKDAAGIVVWGKIYKSFLFDDIRMPIGLINEDDWTTWKLYYLSKTIAITTKKLYYYTINPTSTMAALKKKPDLKYFAAYDERISFFINREEIDLEHCSRMQLCKSLVMIYANGNIEKDDKRIIKSKFAENWRSIKSSRYISKKYKTVFFMFRLAPKMTSILINRIKAE